MAVSADIKNANLLNEAMTDVKTQKKIFSQYHNYSYEDLDKHYTIDGVRKLDSAIQSAQKEFLPAVEKLELRLTIISSTLTARNSCVSNASAAGSPARKKRRT